MSSNDPASIIAVGAVMPALGIVAVALRFYCRRRNRNPLQIDDWILIPALLLTIGMGASLIAGVRLHALGYPTPFTGDPNDPSGSAHADEPIHQNHVADRMGTSADASA